jgi:hypothetical protein
MKIAELEMREKEENARSLRLTLDLAKYKDIVSTIISVKKSNGWAQTDLSDLSVPC